MNKNKKSWAVIGSGTLGLCISKHLIEAGHRVEILDAGNALGGLAATCKSDSYEWDKYYHVISPHDRYLLDLLEELKLSSLVAWRNTKTDFFDGCAISPLNNVWDFIRLPGLGYVDKARLALNILLASQIKQGDHLESISAQSWLTKWSGRNTYENLWRPLLRSKLGQNAHLASGSYIWSVIRRFYSARQGTQRTEAFGYLTQSYRAVIDALHASLVNNGTSIRLGTVVHEVSPRDAECVVKTNQGTFSYDEVVFTGPCSAASSICPMLSNSEHEGLNSIQYQGVVCTSALIKKPLTGAYMTYITDESTPFTTVIQMSALVGTERFGGNHLIYLPRYVPSSDSLLSEEEPEIENRFICGATRMYADLKESDFISVKTFKAPHVLAIPTLNYSKSRPQVITSVPGFNICNSAQITNAALAVNESVEHAANCSTVLLAKK